MNNAKKIIAISVFAIAIIAVLIFTLTSKNDSKENNVVNQEPEPKPIVVEQATINALTPTEEGGVDIVKVIGDEELAEDFMTDTEKGKMGIDKSLRVQVLARDELGNILGYTILPQGAEPETNIREAVGSE